MIGRGVFSPNDVAQVASASAAHLGGMQLNGSVTVNSAVLAPSGLSAVAGNNAATLAWSTMGGAASYNVKRGISLISGIRAR